MRFLFDNNMPPPLSAALRFLSKPVVHVRDIRTLGNRALDDIIMQYAAEHGYTVVTRDLDQMDQEWFKPTLLTLKASYIFVRATRRKGMELQAWPMAKLVIKAWDEIERYTEVHGPTFTALVKPGGGVTTYKK